jgi:TonB family protein
MVEVRIDEEGSVGCARALSGHPLMRRAAVEAAMKWRFKPLKVNGEAKSYTNFLPLVVHWDIAEAEKQCSKERRRA